MYLNAVINVKNKMKNKENKIKDWQQPDGIQHSLSTTGRWEPDNYLDSRTPEERKEDRKIKAETTISEKTLREQIINIVSVSPDHEGGTGYLKLTDEEIDKIVKLFKQNEKEILKNVKHDLDLMFWRIGHQIKIHRVWLLKEPEEEIIKFVRAMARQIRDKFKEIKR